MFAPRHGIRTAAMARRDIVLRQCLRRGFRHGFYIRWKKRLRIIVEI